jgi:hypothetical protein
VVASGDKPRGKLETATSSRKAGLLAAGSAIPHNTLISRDRHVALCAPRDDESGLSTACHLSVGFFGGEGGIVLTHQFHQKEKRIHSAFFSFWRRGRDCSHGHLKNRVLTAVMSKRLSAFFIFIPPSAYG